VRTAATDVDAGTDAEEAETNAAFDVEAEAAAETGTGTFFWLLVFFCFFSKEIFYFLFSNFYFEMNFLHIYRLSQIFSRPT